MAEQTFRSPGFFEQEIDLSARQIAPVGTPAGVIGTAEQGPAFVPVTVGSFADFESKFGSLNPDRFGPYAVREFLKHRTSLTYIRVLGAGSNASSTDLNNTDRYGTVKNAGFVLTGSMRLGANNNPAKPDKAIPFQGGVAVISAKHTPVAHEAASYSLFTDNQSTTDADVNLVRGVVFLATGSQLSVLDHDQAYGVSASRTRGAEVGAVGDLTALKYFKIVLSSSAGSAFSNDEGFAGIRILTASLDPNDGQYIGKILNTDPLKFQKEEHLLYLDYAVEHELAPVKSVGGTDTVAISSGTMNTTTDNGLRYENIVGRYDTRYTTPKTTSFISQPFGKKEFDLFHFETISDGANANDKYKVSIANLRASTDPKVAYGSFEVQLRIFDDKDTSTEIIERYPECNLDPRSERYVARIIGDKKVKYDFDQEDPAERRLVISGKYPNLSSRIRIQMNPGIESGEIPPSALPFGFRGVPVLKTNNSLTDTTTGLKDTDGVQIGETISADNRKQYRFWSNTDEATLRLSIIPPLPYRFKVTKGEASDAASPGFVGSPGKNERTDGRLYWGVNTIRIPTADAATNPVLSSNNGNTVNPLVRSYTKFQGIQKLDALVTGSGVDNFNSNKFTLARVAFSNKTAANSLSDIFSAFTGSAQEHMLEAAYIRDGVPDSNTYTVSDRASHGGNRFTLASLVHTSSVIFNRFTSFAKFTNIFHGGFDGLNILDKDLSLFRDRSLSTDSGGKSVETGMDIGLPDIGSKNQGGFGRRSNSNESLRRAVDIITDPMSSRINILAIPGVRETFVTDHALDKVKDYQKAIYLLDTLKYDESGARLYDDSKARVDVRETSERFESRAINNNYSATYFPDVVIQDPVNNRSVKAPASVAALGTLGFNDRVSFPWFAPAGFNRGGMDFVTNVETRLTSGDRDTLYDSRINPIAVFPNTGFVIFGQKTLQFEKSALDRVNVRRLMIEIKRQVAGAAERFLFEPNNATTRARFVNQITPLLGLIQLQAGIEQFKVICDSSNNSTDDVEQNRLNGRIVVVPTRAVEFISIDFIVTNTGVSFE